LRIARARCHGDAEEELQLRPLEVAQASGALDGAPMTLKQIASSLASEGHRGWAEKINEAEASLRAGVDLVSNAFAHVSHGGPTRADAEKWLETADAVLKG
jgi:hypothetical protein